MTAVALEIILNTGARALVSEEDFELISRHRWCCSEASPSKFYAIRHEHRHMCPFTGKQRHKTLYMHRIVTGAAPGEIVDHINGNGLDNRRENLRIVDASLNCVNRRSYKPASGYRGVYASGTRWRAVLTVRGRDIRGGSFASKEEAARRYDELAREHWGEHAVLNFPAGA